MRNGAPLMLSKCYFGVDARENNVPSIVFTRTACVESFIVFFDQCLPPPGIPPYPVLKRILDGLLFLLRQCCFLTVQHTGFTPVGISHGIINAHIAQVQRVFQNPIGVGALCSIGYIGIDVITAAMGLPGDVPLCGKGRKVDLNDAPQIEGDFQRFFHELLDIVLVDPHRAEAHLDFGGIQVFRLNAKQRFDIRKVASVDSGCERG